MNAYYLAQRIALELEAKLIHSERIIRQWYDMNDGQVYVSFSAGKDSTVLAYLVLRLYKDVPIVFCDTGLEFPELKDHVKVFTAWIEKRLGFRPNVVIVRPKKTFRQVIDEHGYPVVSKEQAAKISQMQRGTGSAERRRKLIEGFPRPDGTMSKFGKISKKWQYLIKAPFKISDYCCEAMKEQPLDQYERETGRLPFVGVLASESRRRHQAYIAAGGCNNFKAKKHKRSWPLAIWTEQNILQFIVDEKIPIASVYGEIVRGKVEPDGSIQPTMFSDKTDLFVTTGEKRTGCMFCMFGIHKDGQNNRFVRMKRTHPKIYEYCMNSLGLKKVLEFMKLPH